MGETKKVLMTLNFSSDLINNFDGLVKDFESKGFEVTLVPSYSRDQRDEMIAALQGKYAFVLVGENMTREVLEACPDLKILSRMGAGYDEVDVAAATDLGIAVTVTPGANAPAVAEHALGLMLASTRQIALLDKKTRAGVWGVEFGIGVFGKTLGLVGMGAVGKLLAKYVSGFEMRVLAYDPYPDEAFAKANNIELVSLEELLRESDFISLHCPYMESTHNIIGREQIAMMKANVQIINCARGKLIDEAALYEAIVAGKVAGAGLDCWEHEPVNMDNPLLTHDRVVATSHTAGMTYEVRKIVVETAFANVVDIAGGELPRGLINPDAIKK